MAIRKFGSTHADILLQCSLRSSAALTAAGITARAGCTVSSQGIECATGGADMSGWATAQELSDLADSGQFSIDVTTIGATEYDDSAGSVSGSAGVDRAAGYLASWERQDGTDEGRVYDSAAEQWVIRSHAGDGANLINNAISSIGKGEVVTLTFAWDADTLYMHTNNDPEPWDTDTRTAGWGADIFYKFILGVAWNGTTSPFGSGYYLSNFIIAKNAPGRNINVSKSFSVFGDSYAAAMVSSAGGPKYDSLFGRFLQRFAAKIGYDIEVDGNVGGGGKTICNTGSNDLEDDGDFASFLTNFTYPNVIIPAGNNDSVNDNGGGADSGVTAAQVLSATDGVYAVLTDWLDRLKADGRRRVYVCTSRSFTEDATLDLAGNATQRALVDAEKLRAVDDWLAANSGMTVRMLDLFALLGSDLADNINYQGRLNEIGNVTTGAGSKDNAHPSAHGDFALANGAWTFVASDVFGVSSSGRIIGSIIE